LIEVEDGANFLLELNSRLDTSWYDQTLVPLEGQRDEDQGNAETVATTGGLLISALFDGRRFNDAPPG
jgi:hypothetical protein